MDRFIFKLVHLKCYQQLLAVFFFHTNTFTQAVHAVVNTEEFERPAYWIYCRLFLKEGGGSVEIHFSFFHLFVYFL